MKITTEKQVLMEAISTVSRALPVRSTMPILEGIYLRAQENTVILKCTDMVLGIETRFSALIEGEGEMVLPGRMLAEIIRKLPDEGEVLIEAESELSVVIKCKHARTRLMAQSAAEYPKLPEIAPEWSIKTEGQTIKRMVEQVVFAIAVDESRPILTGVLIEQTGDELVLCALDGYRLALRRMPYMADSQREIVVRGRSLSEIARLIGDWKEHVELEISSRYLGVTLGATRVVTQLMQGEFVKYKQIIPSSAPIRVFADSKELLGALERAQILAKEGRNNLIKFRIENNSLILTASSESGDLYENIPVEAELNNPLTIAFNAKFFQDVLQAADEGTVCLEFTNVTSACVLRNSEGSNYVYLVLPVRVAG